MDLTKWDEVTEFFNGAIDSAAEPRTLPADESSLVVEIYSPALDKTLSVTVPTRKVEDFMKGLPLFEAIVWNGTEFCTSCGGPYGEWLAEQYDGHWDTCPNRPKGK